MRTGLFILLIFFVESALFGQQPLELQLRQRGEVVVSFDATCLRQIPDIGSWSVDRVTGDKAFVYLNPKRYKMLLDLGIPFVPELAPSLLSKAKMAGSVSEARGWDAFPDYDTYLAMMRQFAMDYPGLCRLDTIGVSVENRLLLALKISDNVALDEPEPEFFYSSTMHGDEVAGYVLMLRLADYLLTNYSNPEIKDIVDNVEIYINPLANPDGTFASGNSTINGAKRYNANNIDINRNFPDPKGGDHPDGEAWQPETLAMMDFMAARTFNVSMNFHGGAELLNYPWDTFGKRHADNNWFIYVCREYADTVHTVDDTYMTDINNGITNGYDWYPVEGGRQDYVTYFLHGREITTELSGVKLIDASELPGLWDKNYRSLLNFVKQATYGISGKVTDAAGNPVPAKVTIPGFDKDSSFVRTQAEGMFYRYLKAGSYNIQVEAYGYDTKTVNSVIVADNETTFVDVVLDKATGIASAPKTGFMVYPNPAKNSVSVRFLGNISNGVILKLVSVEGREVYKKNVTGNNSVDIPVSNLPKGVYFVWVNAKNTTSIKKLVVF